MGNSLRVTELSMKGKYRQESRRQTGKYNPILGVLLSTSTPLGKREREREVGEKRTERY